LRPGSPVCDINRVPQRPVPTFLPRERVAWHESAGEWPCPDLTSALARRVAETPQRVLYVAGDERITPVDLAERVSRLARGLRGLGVRCGDVVSWQLPNWLEGVVLTFALDRLGAVSNPMLPIYREREVGFVVRQARSRVLVVPGELRGFDHRTLARTVRAESPDLAHVVVVRAEPGPDEHAYQALCDGPTDSAAATPPGPHDVTALFYTSGTTSDPKGVLHTPSTLGSFVRTHFTMTGRDRDQVGILWFPLAHIGGICVFGIGPVINGTRTVFLEQFDPDSALDLIERERVTNGGGPTPILQALLAARSFAPARVASVRTAGLGGTDVPPELIRELRAKLGAFVSRSYGMTECPMATGGTPDDAPDELVNTDGRPAPGVRLRAVDDSRRAVAPRAEGELELFGPQLCVGYHDARLSDEAFTPDGFLRTGDLAVIDDAGFVRITGRKKDIIIRKGENLSAKAIEDELYEHPKIADVAVIGVPDRTSGERVCACVVLRPGADPITLDELRGFMTARNVMAQKIPEQVAIVGELPRNATGKVKKYELRARFAGAGSRRSN
jgi:cyclohexanecarboxylate-CoA ligase